MVGRSYVGRNVSGPLEARGLGRIWGPAGARWLGPGGDRTVAAGGGGVIRAAGGWPCIRSAPVPPGAGGSDGLQPLRGGGWRGGRVLHQEDGTDITTACFALAGAVRGAGVLKLTS